MTAGSWSRNRWKSWTLAAVGRDVFASRRNDAAATSGLSGPRPSRPSASSSAVCRADRPRTICTATRRRLSTSRIRRLMAIAHNSPIVNGSTVWYARTMRRRLSGSKRLSVWAM